MRTIKGLMKMGVGIWAQSKSAHQIFYAYILMYINDRVGSVHIFTTRAQTRYPCR